MDEPAATAQTPEQFGDAHSAATISLVDQVMSACPPAEGCSLRRVAGDWVFTVDGGESWQVLAWEGESEGDVLARAGILAGADENGLADAAAAPLPAPPGDAGRRLSAPGPALAAPAEASPDGTVLFGGTSRTSWRRTAPIARSRRPSCSR